MAAKSLFMESTEVPAQRTIGDILGKLQGSGLCRRTSTELKDGKVVAVDFSVQVVGEIEWYYRLPARVEPVFAQLNKRYPFRTPDKNREIAERVAWRQLLRWIEAQLAMLETGMANTHEVFMPYRLVGTNQTLFEHYMGGELKKLEAPKEAK